jgi:hypothetical protein
VLRTQGRIVFLALRQLGQMPSPLRVTCTSHCLLILPALEARRGRWQLARRTFGYDCPYSDLRRTVGSHTLHLVQDASRANERGEGNMRTSHHDGRIWILVILLVAGLRQSISRGQPRLGETRAGTTGTPKGPHGLELPLQPKLPTGLPPFQDPRLPKSCPMCQSLGGPPAERLFRGRDIVDTLNKVKPSGTTVEGFLATIVEAVTSSAPLSYRVDHRATNIYVLNDSSTVRYRVEVEATGKHGTRELLRGQSEETLKSYPDAEADVSLLIRVELKRVGANSSSIGVELFYNVYLKDVPVDVVRSLERDSKGFFKERQNKISDVLTKVIRIKK